MSSERMAYQDGFDKGYAKATERIALLEAENEQLKEALKNPQGCGMDGCLFQKYNWIIPGGE